MQLIPVTICTDRKKEHPPEALLARNLHKGSQGEVLRDWLARLARSEQRYPAKQVYCGRSFGEAVTTAECLGMELRIVSTGLGLIKATARIPSYSLSVTPRTKDYVGSRISSDGFDEASWWRDINASARSERPIHTLLTRNPKSVVAIALSRSYLGLIAQEFDELKDEHLERIRIFGLSIGRHLNERVRPYVVPYDDRLDGKKSPIRGTRGDFAQRAMRHFAEVIWPGARTSSAEKHGKAVNSLISTWPRAPKFNRSIKSDSELCELIAKLWAQAGGRSSHMLRIVRSDMNIACEQSRFKRLFHQVVKQVQE